MPTITERLAPYRGAIPSQRRRPALAARLRLLELERRMAQDAAHRAAVRRSR